MTDKEDIQDGLVEEFYRRSFFEIILGKKPKLRSKQHYKNGKKDGLCEYFDEEGNLTKSETWENGKLVDKDKEKQVDLFGLDEKKREKLASYESPKDQAIKQLKKEEKEQEEKREQQEQEEWDNEEKRMWDVFDYIENNVKDILIPDLEVISHIKPSETEHGFINFLWKYPVFPKRNKEEIQFSKEALYWYKDFHDLWLEDSRYVGDYTSPLGGIRFKDQKKWRYRKSLGSVHALDESDYFENVYSFHSDSNYRYDGWFDDRDFNFTDEGIDFEWSYPPYFSSFDEGLKQFSQRLWEYFLETRVEMTIHGPQPSNFPRWYK